ncbi:CynX/NimT family MFS transporter [Afipia sp. P52-10]|uniref:MFS transporter n=1 Tax=Afipia sp. P52-10 TaxID=1429916 RepID=UPI0004B6916B|nr:MFS transporter [Afipia sp. P52-10]
MVMTPSLARPRTAWVAVGTVVGAGVTAALQVGKAAIAAPLLQADLGLDLAAVGWITAIFAVLGVVGGVPAGAVTARLGDRRVLLAGLVAIALGAAVGGGATTFTVLLGSRVIEGLGFLMIAVSGPAVLQRIVAAGDRDLAFALWSCFMPAGMALAMLTVPLAASWQVYWWCSGALAALSAVGIAVSVAGADSRTRFVWRALVKDAWATLRVGPALLAVSFALYSLMFFALFSFLPVLLMQRMAVSLTAAGFLSALATAANIAGNLIAGVLLSRGASRTTLIGIACAVMSLAALGIFIPVLPPLGALLLCVVFSGVGGMLPATIVATTPMLAPAERLVPVAVGLVMQGSNLGQVIGPVAVGGAIDRFGWPSAAAIVVAAGAAGFVVSLLLRKVLRGP